MRLLFFGALLPVWTLGAWKASITAGSTLGVLGSLALTLVAVAAACAVWIDALGRR